MPWRTPLKRSLDGTDEEVLPLFHKVNLQRTAVYPTRCGTELVSTIVCRAAEGVLPSKDADSADPELLLLTVDRCASQVGLTLSKTAASMATLQPRSTWRTTLTTSTF